MKKSKRKSGAASGGAPRAAELFLTSQAKEDLDWWRKQNPHVFARVESLIEEARRTPFRGRGKPEPLKGEWQGYWSRRITDEHRLVNRAEAGVLYVAQARYHY